MMAVADQAEFVAVMGTFLCRLMSLVSDQLQCDVFEGWEDTQRA